MKQQDTNKNLWHNLVVGFILTILMGLSVLVFISGLFLLFEDIGIGFMAILIGGVGYWLTSAILF